MSEELREPKDFEEIGDVSDGRILQIAGRLAQIVIFLVGARYSLESYAEQGINLETIIKSIITVGGPILIEWAIRTDAQDIHETYHEPGVVEE